MNRILSLFVLFAFFAVNSFAATPTVTVTLSEFTADHSGAGYVVRLSPVTGGTARRELTDSDGVATFTSVTPAIYSLSIENAGVPTLQIRVPDTASTTAASGIVISDWTPPGPSTAPASPWFRGIPYLWPDTQGEANQALVNDGTGVLDWESVLWANTDGLLEPSPAVSGVATEFNGSGVLDLWDATYSAYVQNLAFYPGPSTGAVPIGNYTFTTTTNDVWEGYSAAGFFKNSIANDQTDGWTQSYYGSFGLIGMYTPPISGQYSAAAIGVMGICTGLATNMAGVLGIAEAAGNSANAVGIIGSTERNSFQAQSVGGYFEILDDVDGTNPTFQTAVVLADSRDTQAPLFIGRTNNATVVAQIAFDGAIAAGTTNRWKTGAVVTGATVALTLTNYVSITINGNVYKLGLVQ